ncbi:MAG: RNA polymerase sigma factor [Chloroflexota bacterium]
MMENVLAQPLGLVEPDALLVRRLAEGDEEALRSLHAVYGRRLFAYALRLTGDRALAEEVLQDSLLGAWRGAREFRGEGRVLAWLLSIVHRQALNATRRKQLPVAGPEAAEAASGDAGPEDLAAAGDRRRMLARALTELSPDHRTALSLVFFQGLGLAEVARVCDCPVGTVKSRLNHAKARLRQALGRAGLEAEDLL